MGRDLKRERLVLDALDDAPEPPDDDNEAQPAIVHEANAIVSDSSPLTHANAVGRRVLVGDVAVQPRHLRAGGVAPGVQIIVEAIKVPKIGVEAATSWRVSGCRHAAEGEGLPA